MTQAYLVKFRPGSQITTFNGTALFFFEDVGQASTAIDWFVDDADAKAIGHLVIGRLTDAMGPTDQWAFHCYSVHLSAVLLQMFELAFPFDGQFSGPCAAKVKRLAEGLDPEGEDQPSLFSIQ